MPQFSFNQPFSGIVRHLIIINVLMFFGTNLLMGDGEMSGEIGRFALAAYLPGSAHFQPYQIATYMFMHADLMHLLFNMMTLFFFGPMIEMVWGEKRFLLYYLSCGVGAYLLYAGVQWWQISSSGGDPHLSNIPMLGASGAIFGVLTAFAYLFPNQVISLLFPPVSIKAKYFVPITALLELIYGVRGMATGVAHFAHLGGAVTGILIILLWYRFRLR
jgi:membrane associated rhomboid family serine protease